MTMTNEIENALNQNVDLAAAEYREKVLSADNVTAKHGVEGKAPISEAVRHKRVQTNYYSTMLNISCAILAAIDQQNEILASIYNEVTNGKPNKS